MKCAESIVLTIVEGCGAATNREFARCLDMSIKSASELEGQLQLAKDYRIIRLSDWRTLSDETVEIRRMLYGLRRKVLERDDEADTPEDEDEPAG